MRQRPTSHYQVGRGRAGAVNNSKVLLKRQYTAGSGQSLHTTSGAAHILERRAQRKNYQQRRLEPSSTLQSDIPTLQAGFFTQAAQSLEDDFSPTEKSTNTIVMVSRPTLKKAFARKMSASKRSEWDQTILGGAPAPIRQQIAHFRQNLKSEKQAIGVGYRSRQKQGGGLTNKSQTRAGQLNSFQRGPDSVANTLSPNSYKKRRYQIE